MAASLIRPLGSFASASLHSFYSNLNIFEKPNPNPSHFTHFATKISTAVTNSKTKIIDSHLHVWASPQELQRSTLIFLDKNQPCQAMLISCFRGTKPSSSDAVLPIQQKMEMGGYRAVRFNPYLWPPNEQMTNDIGKAMFSKAGELGVPVGFMCMKGLNLRIKEIEELCSNYPSTTVLLDHLAFCKPPTTDEETLAFSNLLKLSRFPHVYVKFSAQFRVSREKFSYKDLTSMLSKLVSSFGANRVM